MINQLTFKSRHKPMAEITDITGEFHAVHVTKKPGGAPNDKNGEYLWVRFNGSYPKYLYISPSPELRALMAQHCIYDVKGETVYLDVLETASGENKLYMQYQQIIGSRCICDLSDADLADIKDLIK